MKSSPGNKKVIVAIHGLGSAATVWNPIRNKFDATVEFLTVELPGHGNSTVKATREMNPEKLAIQIHQDLLEKGVDDYHLLGNSLGGWIALEMSALFPKEVRSVTALAPAGLWYFTKKQFNFELEMGRFLAKLTYKVAPALCQFKVLRWIGFRGVSPQWKKLSIQTCIDAVVAMGSASGYSALSNAVVGYKFDKKINASIPTTIVFGDSDKILPAKNCQEKSLAPTHARWNIFEKCGHAPMWDGEETTAKILKEYLANF